MNSKNEAIIYGQAFFQEVNLVIQNLLIRKFGRGEGAVLNGGGSGLGLQIYLRQRRESVDSEIAKTHGGEIKIDSEGLGKGSTFSVTLPMIK